VKLTSADKTHFVKTQQVYLAVDLGAESGRVMAIMGGALLPKLMGSIADKYDISRGFIVPAGCFAIVAFYGFNWSKFSRAESLNGTKISANHP
jgi:FHS family L-fucose permease-like MFS transporter